MPVNLYKTHIERSKHLMTESMCLPTHEQRMRYFDNLICKRLNRGLHDTAYYISCYLFVSLVFELPPDDDLLKDPGLANLCSKRLKAFMGHISNINWPVNNSTYMKYLDDCKNLIAKISALKERIIEDEVDSLLRKGSTNELVDSLLRKGSTNELVDSDDFIVVGSILSESKSRDSSPKRASLSNPTSFKCFVKFHDSVVTRCLTMSHKPSKLIVDRLSSAWKICRQNVLCYLSKVIIPEEFIDMVKSKPQITNNINNFNATRKTSYIMSVFDNLAELESQNDWFYQLYMILHAVDEPIASFMYIVILELESKNLTHMLDYQLEDLIHIFMKRSFERIQEFISPDYVNAILELQSGVR